MITAVRIEPGSMFKQAEVHVRTEDQEQEHLLFSFTDDEISFTEDELTGLTEEQARELFFQKDKTYIERG